MPQKSNNANNNNKWTKLKELNTKPSRDQQEEENLLQIHCVLPSMKDVWPVIYSYLSTKDLHNLHHSCRFFYHNEALNKKLSIKPKLNISCSYGSTLIRLGDDNLYITGDNSTDYSPTKLAPRKDQIDQIKKLKANGIDLYLLLSRKAGLTNAMDLNLIDEINGNLSLFKGDKILKLAINHTFTLLLTEKGKVFKWQVYPFNSSIEEVNSETLGLESEDKIVNIEVGDINYLFLTKLGKVYKYDAIKGTFFHLSVSTLESNDKIIQVVEGKNGNNDEFYDPFTLLLTHRGKIFVNGGNRFGQLGLGNEKRLDKDSFAEISSLQLEKGDKVLQLSAGKFHVLLLTQNGRVFAWGRNDYGQLGLGDCKDCSSPTEIKLSDELKVGDIITQVIAGANCSFLLTSHARIFTFGDNQWGQLGLGLLSSNNYCKPKELTFTALKTFQANLQNIINSSENKFTRCKLQ